jgi:hypothetical protein
MVSPCFFTERRAWLLVPTPNEPFSSQTQNLKVKTKFQHQTWKAKMVDEATPAHQEESSVVRRSSRRPCRVSHHIFNPCHLLYKNVQVHKYRNGAELKPGKAFPDRTGTGSVGMCRNF